MSEKISLIVPSEEWKEKALDYKEEHLASGETIIHGGELFDQTDSYEEWLNIIRNNAVKETVNPAWVQTDTFFAVSLSEQKIVGIIACRYELNDFLKDFGHIGYSVRPSKRCQGYATEMLRQVLRIAAQKGMMEVQLSCERSNVASSATILRCGGTVCRSFSYEGQEADVYLIKLID